IQFGGDGARAQRRVPALVGRFERGGDDAAVRAVGETVDRQAGEGHGVLDPRMFAGDVRHALDDLLGSIEGGGVRQLCEGYQVLLVLLWHEAGLSSGEAEVAESEQA